MTDIPPAVRTSVLDFLVIFMVALLALWVQDAFSRPWKTAEEKKEWRMKRHANEIMYEACVSSCQTNCLRTPK